MKYLLLSLSERTCRVFCYNGAQLTCIKNIEADLILSFDPPAEGIQKDALIHIFMHKVDDELSPLLKEYALPFFVVGKIPLLRRFRKLTTNNRNVDFYIPIMAEELNEDQLTRLIGPPLINWKTVSGNTHAFHL